MCRLWRPPTITGIAGWTLSLVDIDLGFLVVVVVTKALNYFKMIINCNLIRRSPRWICYLSRCYKKIADTA